MHRRSMSDISTNTSNDQSKDGPVSKKLSECNLIREKTIHQIDGCDGEEVIDHETEFCIQEEQYEEQVRLWLR